MMKMAIAESMQGAKDKRYERNEMATAETMAEMYERRMAEKRREVRASHGQTERGGEEGRYWREGNGP